MTGRGSASSWKSSAWQAVLVLLAVAMVARVVWELLGPLLPGLVVLAMFIAIYSLLMRRPR